MSNKTINKVRVIVDFPGYKAGDILELDPSAGIFNFGGVHKEGEPDGTFDALDTFASNITGDVKHPITKKEVLGYMGTLFEDISTYKVRSYRELEIRVEELKAHMERIEKDTTLDFLDKEEALTVWQNMLWEYEWIMGMKELYFSNCNTDSTAGSKQESLGEFVDGFVDGNAMETNNESDDINEDRQDS